MPKAIWKLNQFHGGLNSNADPRDITDTEVSEATDVMVDEIGRIRTLGGTTAHAAGTDAGTKTIAPGYGLTHFNHDKVYQIPGRINTFTTNASPNYDYNTGTYIVEPTGGTGSGAKFEVKIEVDTACVDYEINNYSTEIFGSQVWMSENLKSTKYRDGTDIVFTDDEDADADVWQGLTSGAYSQGGDGTSADANYEGTYGFLYNWHAVEGKPPGGDAGDENLAPTGWRVPSSHDWKVLEGYIDTTNKIVLDAFGTATSTSSGNLVDTNSVDFTGLGLGTDDKIFNKTDVTWTDITSVTDANTIQVDTNIFVDEEEYIVYDWDTEWDGTGERGVDAGSALAGNADLWTNGDLEDNSAFGTSSFNALPGGYRKGHSGGTGGNYSNKGSNAYFWSSTEYDASNAWYRLLGYDYSGVDRNYRNKKGGLSVRCVKDVTQTITITIIDSGKDYSDSDELTILGALLGSSNITVTLGAPSNLGGADIPAASLLAYANKTSGEGNLDLYDATDDSWNTGLTTFGTISNDYEAVMYLADGSLKICDKDFDNNSTSKVYEHVFLNASGSLGVNAKHVFNQELTKPVLGGGGDKVEVSSSNPSNDGQINISVVEGSSGTWDTTGATYTLYATYTYRNQESLPTLLSTDFFPRSEDKSQLVTVKIESTGNLISERIEAINFYYSNNSDEASDLLLLVSAHLEKGLQQHGGKTDRWTIESTYIHATATVEAASYTTFEARNGFSPDETIDARYKTALVTNRRAYIGNVYQNGQVFGDRMIKSPINKFDTFPESNIIEASIQDGDEIVKLEEYADRILQFKKNKMHLINVSQELEFLEDTFIHKGVSHPAATCKTDYGIAWVNEFGCYLYDGKEVHNLLERKGMQIIRESEWDNFLRTDKTSSGTRLTPMIGYLPKKRQLIVFDDITTGSTADPRMYLYDMVTQSWIKGANDDSTRVIDKIKTNFTTDSNGDLVYITHTDSNTLKWDDAADASSNFNITTKDIDFGHPGVRKKIYKVYLTFRGNGGHVQVHYGVDGLAPASTFFLTNANGTTTGSGATAKCIPHSVGVDDWVKAELKPGSPINNVSSFRLKISGDSSTPIAETFEINDMSIVYRLKPIK